MSGAVDRSGGLGAAIAVVLLGLAVGAAAGWWQAEERFDLAALEEEMAAAMRVVDPVERRGALLAVITKLRPETLPAIRAGLEREFQLADRCVVPPFAAAWASFDPIGAFEAATDEWSNAFKRSQVTSEVTYVLGRTGRIERARYLASQLPVPRVRYPTWAGLADGMIRAGDLEGATAFLLEHPDSADRNRIIERFLQYFMLTRDHEGLIAWVDGIPSDAPNKIKKSAFGLAARWLSSVDPERAAAWVEAQPEDAGYLGLAHLGVAEEWIEHDPEAALDWIMARTTPGDRKFVMRGVLRRFVERSPKEASDWMARQEPLGDAEVGIPILVRALRDERPADALVWAERLSDPKRRDEMIAFVAGQWMAREPEAAAAWVAKKQLPESLRQQIEAERLDAAEDDSRWP